MILVLMGATGTGKSALAITLAKRVGAEIINADAFQVYQGLNIATAVPSEEEKSAVPHHLYGYVPLSEGYNIARYQIEARAVIEEIKGRGHLPLFVGGSGLYLRAALYDYSFQSVSPSADMSAYDDLSDEDLHRVLERLDPLSAQAIHPHNRLRVRRAIVICLESGEPKSELEARQHHATLEPTRFFCLTENREDLYPQVEKRVDKMFADGLLEETKPLIERYGREAPAFKAIGVKELFPYLDGKESLEEVKAAIKADTRHYIKRQETFFRHQFPAEEVRDLEDIIKAL